MVEHDYAWLYSLPWLTMVEVDHGHYHGWNNVFPNHYVTLLRLVGVVLCYDVHQCSHCISTSLNGFVTQWSSSKLMLHYDILQWQCDIAKFIKVDVTLQHKTMSHWNRHQRLHCIMTSMDVYVTMWHAWMHTFQCGIQQCLCHNATFITVDIPFWNPTRVMSHCDVHQSSCRILKSINGYVAFWWMTLPLRTGWLSKPMVDDGWPFFSKVEHLCLWLIMFELFVHGWT